MARSSRISKFAATDRVRRLTGKRSGLEVQIGAALDAIDPAHLGEKEIEPIEYSSLKPRKYHPDFELGNGILIEAKGWFKPADRTKHLTIKHHHPHLDIRFVFSNPQAKLRASKTTYAEWCTKNGFKFAKGLVPHEWVNEPKKK